MKIVIYGAQGMALGAYKAIKIMFPEKEVCCFLVTSMENNTPMLGGIPVRELDDFITGMSQEEKDELEILISTPETVMGAIEKSLEAVGIYNHVRLTSLRWSEMIQNAFIRTGEYMPLSAYPVGAHKADLRIYKMVHWKDTKLETEIEDPDYIVPVQVGAEKSERISSTLADNSGENISEKNRNYSELTGLYWMWKNQMISDENKTNTYYGLAHYRRMLHLTADDLLRLSDNDIDVVLPYPMPYEPDIEAHHKRYLKQEEWNAVLTALRELQPEYADAFAGILKQGYLYNYNIILAKGSVLADYCSWLFPILFRAEEINNNDGIKEPNRFIGYVGETLETLYFMFNKKKLTITHTGCRFLI